MYSGKDTNLKEDDLVEEFIRKKDRESFSKLYKSIEPWLYRMAYIMVGSKIIAEDIVQQTWLKCIENINHFDRNKGRFVHFIYKIGKNCALQTVAKESRLRSIKQEVIDIDPDLRNDITEICSLIKETINKLNVNNYRDAIILFYFAGFSVAEISVILRTNEQNVKNWLSRGRKKIEADLRKNKEFEYIYEVIKKMLNIVLILLK